jgi:signal transduction histidine kinase
MLIKRSMHRRHQLIQQSSCVLFSLIAFVLLAAYEGRAKERLYRMLDRSSGLPSASLSGYAQDTNGFFWISTAAGLFRYDGTEFRQWARDKLTGWHYMVYPAPDGEVFVYDLNHTLYHLLPNEDAEPVMGPDGKPFSGVQSAAITKDNRLWAARLDGLFYRNQQDRLVAMPKEIPGNEKIWRLSPGGDGGLYVAMTQSIWKINPDLSYSKILAREPRGYITNLILHPDGSLFFMEKYADDDGKIFQWRDGRVTELIALKANLQGFVLRGRTVWANTDKCLIAFRESAEPEVLRVPTDIPGSGFLVVDNEGSLWMGSVNGLMQIPEPDTVIFGERDGLPNGGVRYLRKNEEGLWAATWFGRSLIEGKDNDWRVRYDATNPSWLGLDGKGTLWGHSDNGSFFRRANGKFIKLLPPTPDKMNDSSQAADGALWIASDKGLWRTPLHEGSPRFLGDPLGDGVAIDSVFEDSRGRLWLTKGDKIGYVSAAAVDSGQEVSCSLQTLAGSRGLRNIIELPNGSLWVGTQDKGVWRYTNEEGWKPIPASLKQASRRMGGFALSPIGGVWVLGLSARIRVIDRPDLPDGWQVVEELSDWQGVPSALTDLIEEPDGSLWIASQSGVVHMPAEVRRGRIGPPRVELAGLIMNGERVDLSSAPQIPPGHNQLEIHFAALSYRDRSLLKYQYRLHPNDRWTDSASNVPVFRFFDLRPGEYTAEVRASLDGVNWSRETARIVFSVLPPWYMRWWTIALGLLLTGLALYAAHRARVAIVVRLERQRTLIAMDLHDEIGSGLGSIGILSSVAASTTLGESQRQELTRQIADTASELGSSLTDIVWSLRKESATLEGLAYHLTRRAGKLFSNGAAFTTAFPETWALVSLSLPTRRSVLLIALEAIHNAARHANANHVVLGIAPLGKRWKLWVEDDGCGMNGDEHQTMGTGIGLLSMKQRADEIGAKIHWSSKNGKGTVVTLEFSAQAKGR